MSKKRRTEKQLLDNKTQSADTLNVAEKSQVRLLAVVHSLKKGEKGTKINYKCINTGKHKKLEP